MRRRQRFTSLVATVACICGTVAVPAGSASAATKKPSPAPTTSQRPSDSNNAGATNEREPTQGNNNPSTTKPKPDESDKPAANAKPDRKPGQNIKDENYAKCSTESDNGADQRKPVSPECQERRDAAADRAAATLAAQELLAAADAEMEKALPIYNAAKRKKGRLDKRLAELAPAVDAANQALARFARQSYMLGIDPSILTQVASLDSGSPLAYEQAQSAISRVGSIQANELVRSRELIAQVEQEKTQADAEFTAAKATFDLIQFNQAAAKYTLGLATGAPSQDSAKFFETYPLQPCEFSNAINTTRSCTQAQQYAMQEVANPSKDWFYLCLNFVTLAYGAPQSIPRAIDQWNGLPEEAKRSPNTVAPAGALMFWAPNHVALSLGNNMVASTDVLGNGRIWIVPIETIQARWNMPYLGWTEPDFRNA